MTRVLYVVNIPRFFLTHRLPLALAAQEAGYDVHVATSDHDRESVEAIRATGLPYHPLPLSQHGTSLWTEIGTVRALVRLYRELEPDLVHHVSIKPVLYGGLAARLTGRPGIVGAMSGLGYVFVGDGVKPRVLRAAIVPAMRAVLRGDRLRTIFQNPDDRDRFVRLGIVREPATRLIRGSGVDLSHYCAAPEPADGLPVVLFAGRLLWAKGVRAFVQAATDLAGRARFVIVGIPEASNPSAVPESQLVAWRDAGLVEWWGHRTDMPSVYASAHVVCLPSTYGEGVPKTLIEAAAVGRACITTDTPGCREVVRDGVNGRLVAPDDPAALEAALVEMLDDPERRRAMGAAGRRIVEDEFSLDHVVESTFAVYRELVP